jgi:putative ABC transport system ATP-binding protein
MAADNTCDISYDVVLEAKDVTKFYRLGDEIEVHALDGVSLQVCHGEMLSIMGPSGSGKSTLMHIVGLLDTPTSGSVQLEGVEVSKMTPNELSLQRNKRIGFVFQSFNLLPRTSAIDNVELPLIYAGVGGAERHKRAMAELERVGLGNRLNNQPSQLSGGQQQRVAIARSLVNNPSIILADEPTGALDSRIGLEIMAIFQRLNREAGITMIVVTHDPDIAAYSNRSIHFKDGRLQLDQRHAQPRDARKDLEQLPAEPPEEGVSS